MSNPDRSYSQLDTNEVVLDGTVVDVLNNLERQDAATTLLKLLDIRHITGVSVLDVPVNQAALYELINDSFNQLAPVDPYSEFLVLPPLSEEQLRPLAAYLISLLASARTLNPSAPTVICEDAEDISSDVRTQVYDFRRRVDTLASLTESLDVRAQTVVTEIFQRKPR